MDLRVGEHGILVRAGLSAAVRAAPRPAHTHMKQDPCWVRFAPDRVAISLGTRARTSESVAVQLSSTEHAGAVALTMNLHFETVHDPAGTKSIASARLAVARSHTRRFGAPLAEART